MRHALATSLCLLALGCGGLANEPLTLGVVRGRLLEADQTAIVAVLGRPELYARPSATTGEFELKAVPQGQLELLALASPRGASRLSVEVRGGGVAQVGAVTPRPAGNIELKLHSPSWQRLGLSRLSVVGTPHTQLAITDEGGANAGPLPAGCYDVTVDAPGLGSVTRLTCVSEGADTHLEFDLPEPDGSEGHEGCSVTGCEDGHTCSSSGRCL